MCFLLEVIMLCGPIPFSIVVLIEFIRYGIGIARFKDALRYSYGTIRDYYIIP